MNRNRKVITGPEKSMIMRVLKFFEEEKQNRAFTVPIGNVLKRTSKATGISVSSIKRIRAKAGKFHDSLSSDSDTIPKPVKRRKDNRNKIQYSEEILNGLRQIVDSYIQANGKMMSLNDTLDAAKKYLQFPAQRGTLRKVLIEQLGYVFENNYRKHRRKKREPNSSSSSGSDEESDGPPESALEIGSGHDGIEAEDNQFGDPSMLCEVAIKEET